MLKATLAILLAFSVVNSTKVVTHYHFHFEENKPSPSLNKFVRQSAFILGRKMDKKEASDLVNNCYETSNLDIKKYHECIFENAPVSNYVCVVIYKLYNKHAGKDVKKLGFDEIKSKCEARTVD